MSSNRIQSADQNLSAGLHVFQYSSAIFSVIRFFRGMPFSSLMFGIGALYSEKAAENALRSYGTQNSIKYADFIKSNHSGLTIFSNDVTKFVTDGTQKIDQVVNDKIGEYKRK